MCTIVLTALLCLLFVSAAFWAVLATFRKFSLLVPGPTEGQYDIGRGRDYFYGGGLIDSTVAWVFECVAVAVVIVALVLISQVWLRGRVVNTNQDECEKLPLLVD